MLVARVSIARSTRSRGGGTWPATATTETGRSFPPSPKAGVSSRELPRAQTRRPHTSPDSPAHDRIARFEALLPPRVRSRGARTSCRDLRPDPPERSPGRCSPGIYALLELSPPHPRVRSIAKKAGEPDFPGRPRLAPEAERGASILRPRPSESDGCARVAARSAPTADVAHVRAPSRRRPCLSCPCRRVAATDRDRRDAGLQRSEGYGGGSISWRPTSSFRVVRLLDVRARRPARAALGL